MVSDPEGLTPADTCTGGRPMKLDAKQIKQFEDEGWLFLPDCFSPEEVAALRTEAEAIYKLDRPQIWREKSGAPRTAFAAHTYNEAFGLLGRHPRLIAPGGAGVRRAALHAPVQDQRQSQVRRRRVAVAPGLRHLGARRRHARAQSHEHLGVPRRGLHLQRPADADPQEPQARRAGRRPRQGHHQLSAVDARSHHRREARRRTAGWSCPPASPAAC